MKIVTISTSAGEGGAFVAARRIHLALNKADIDSTILVRDESVNIVKIISLENSKFTKITHLLKQYFSNISLHFYRKRQKLVPFSASHLGDSIENHPMVKSADIIHLHWLHFGFLSIRNIGKLGDLNKPIVWTLHDMWAFTGGCHFSEKCDKYRFKCGKCPILCSKSEMDLTKILWNIKQKYYKNLKLTIVTPSYWLKNCVSNSSLFKDIPIEVIPYPIDTNIFKPISKNIARNILNINSDKKIILFGAGSIDDKRKGFKYLIKALNYIKTSKNDDDDFELLVFGKANTNIEMQLPYKTYFIGTVKDEQTLALCYNASDVFIAPSLEDNLPNTVIESLSCSIPVVAFNIGGMPDMIDHLENGYLCNDISSKQLAKGIKFVLKDENRLKFLKEKARDKVLNNFSMEIISKKYAELYKRLI